MNEKKDFLLESEPPTACAATCPLNTPVMQRLLTLLTPRPFRKRHPILFWGGILLLLLSLVAIGTAWMGKGALAQGDRIAVVRVEGMIADTRPLLHWIDKISRDGRVKGVLLRIDSPGGGAAASQELHAALQNLDARKPVVASLGSVAASGGLMAAMAARHVVANPSTVTGSIGVRMDIPQLQGLMGKLGVSKETLTTGRFKDAGSSVRPLSREERAYFSGVLQDMHDQFVLLVAEGRKLPVERVVPLADGRIMTGREAKELQLVDELGGQETALAHLRKLTGVAASTSLLEQPQKYSLLKEMLESVLELEPGARASSPAFLYAY